MAQTTRHPAAVPPHTTGLREFVFGPFRLNLTERSLRRHGIPVPLGARAYDLLVILVQRAGQVVRHDELIAHVWADVSVSPGTPRVHLSALRKSLGCRPDRVQYIINVPGRGYCFVAPVVMAGAPEQHHAAVGETGAIPRDPTSPVTGEAVPGQTSTGRPGRGAAAGLHKARQTSLGSALEPTDAEQFLAKPNTAHGQAAGRLSQRQGLVTETGRRGERGTSNQRIIHDGDNPEMVRRRQAISAAIALLTSVAADANLTTVRAEAPLQSSRTVTHHRTTTVDGIEMFYREAGPADGPVVLLLHGFPTSSHMFRNLIPLLADRWRVIAPDYPGFGQSAMPDRASFAYTFDRYGELVGTLLDQLGVRRYAMYVMDYGAPVGWRLALGRPDSVTGLIVQNGNAYEEGLQAFWDPIRAYWADNSPVRRDALRFLVAPETTRFQYTDGVRDISRIAPDNWVHDQALLDRPGNAEIQLDLFYDYRTNLPLYPRIQAWLRRERPPTLIVWGANDTIFPAEGAHPFMRDLPEAEMHLLDTGHFALEDKLDVMAPMIRDFLDRKSDPR
ncbi:alpha/beta fold hydrolase [Paracraurococcus ruber]|nr:alpha/beta fold hydrolase [Paracraurococcus ruber]